MSIRSRAPSPRQFRLASPKLAQFRSSQLQHPQSYGKPTGQLHESPSKSSNLRQSRLLWSYSFNSHRQSLEKSIESISPRCSQVVVEMNRAGFITRVLERPPVLALKGSMKNRLKSLMEEFQSLGFREEDLHALPIGDRSLLLRMEVGELSSCLELIRDLKCRPMIKRKISAKGPLRTAIDVKLRVDCLCKRGLNRRDAFRILFREPRVILYAMEDVEKKLNYLIDDLGFGIESLVEVPEYLGVNMEKRILPRHNVVQHLRSKRALGFDVELKHFVKLSRLRFYNMFVKPYPECEELFSSGDDDRAETEVEVKAGLRRSLSGLWKLFQPHKYKYSEEDNRNMRSFMELQFHQLHSSSFSVCVKN